MKKRILCLTAFLMVLCTAYSQRLVPMNRFGANWGTEKVSTKNKPNGYIYRLREEKQCADLPQVDETKGLELFISEKIDIGWLGFYRLPMGDNNYDFVVVLYDHDKQPQTMVNLCDVTNNRYCEVQDVRWDADNHYLLFNMACPSYASEIGGKGSKLYCYDIDKHRIVWETDYLVSNDIFILDHNYVFCSYGFTSEKKFLFMLDKLTGKVYSKLPMVYSVQYMELQEKNGKELLYVVDYNNHLYTFAVSNSQAKKPANSTAAKKGGGDSKVPEVFTVVYATSEDGFMNVRSQPSNSGKILGKLYHAPIIGGGDSLPDFPRRFLQEKGHPDQKHCKDACGAVWRQGSGRCRPSYETSGSGHKDGQPDTESGIRNRCHLCGLPCAPDLEPSGVDKHKDTRGKREGTSDNHAQKVLDSSERASGIVRSGGMHERQPQVLSVSGKRKVSENQREQSPLKFSRTLCFRSSNEIPSTSAAHA